jgi:hypothetical protein
MYSRRERPLTEAERELLGLRLRHARGDRGGLVFHVILWGLTVGLLVFAVVMVCLGKDRSDARGRVLGAVAGLVAVGAFVCSVRALPAQFRLCRELREAVADETAVEERFEAREVAVLDGAGAGGCYLFATADGRLVAHPVDFVPEPELAPSGWHRAGGVPACVERVSTRRHRLGLHVAGQGRTRLPVVRLVPLAEVVSDPAVRPRVAERLERSAVFPGTLSTLAADLTRLAHADESSAPTAVPVAADGWSRLQAEVEERFGLALGPGALPARLVALADAERRPPTADTLVELVRRSLPAGASFQPRPLTPIFLRLREALEAECELAKGAVRPSARLEDLFPRRGRAGVRERVERRLGQPLPPPVEEDPPWMAGVTAGAGVLLLYAVGVPAVQAVDAFAVRHGFEGSWWYRLLGMLLVPTTFFGGIALSVVLSMRLWRDRFRLAFSARHATVADLVRFLAESAPGPPGPAVPWTPPTIWQALRDILARVAGRPTGAVRRDSDLHRDLGLPRL